MMQLFPKILKSASGHGNEPLLEEDRPPAILLSVLLVFLVGFMFLVGLAVSQLLEKVNNWHRDDLASRYVNQTLVEARALDKQRLTEYRKNESGTYAINIEQAKALITQRASAAAVK